MKRRTFLIGTGSAAIGGSALLGSGAFSRVESERSLTVQIAEDPSAYLGLDDCMDGDGNETPNSSYAHLDEYGHLEIDMSPSNPTDAGGQGINSDSRTWFDNVFQICNQGKEDVCLYIEDDDDWPYYTGGDEDERRVDFYLGGARTESLVGEGNSILLGLGECVCIGLRTTSIGLSEGDEVLDALDNEIRIIADVDGNCNPPDCPQLSGEYECTVYNPNDPSDPDTYNRTGTRMRIYNVGNSATDFDLAVSNAPGAWEPDNSIDSNANRAVVADASVPAAGLVIWDAPDDCPLGEVEAVEWQDYKDGANPPGDNYDNLTDWYESTGSSNDAPSGAPSDLPDTTLVSDLTGIPSGEPDENIDPADWPCMSQTAYDNGWRTCEQLNNPDQCDYS